MAALIEEKIQPQNFELIRTRIGEILTLELANQVTLIGDNNLNATVWEERFTPFTNDEMPAINVSLDNGTNDQYNPIDDRFDYQYNIDVYTKSKGTALEIGDLKSQQVLQRLCGIVRAILRDSHYTTLGFSSPIIATRHVSSIQIGQPYDKDGNFMAMARITFIVRAIETNGLQREVEASGYDTEVKLEETEKGYYFTLNNN